MPVNITISKTLSSNSAAAPYDVIQIKKALNRLGFYIPHKDIGITDIPDAAVFNALKEFQKKFGLPITGSVKPDDATVNALNREIAKPQKGYYIWNTVGDGKVRPEHAALEGKIRSFDDKPHPGDDFGCRCWAIAIKLPKDVENTFDNVTDKLSAFDVTNSKLSAKLLRHYLGGTGDKFVIDEKELSDKSVVKSAIEKNQERFEDDFNGVIKLGKINSFNRAILSMPSNSQIKLSDLWDVDVDKFSINLINDFDFLGAIGSAKIQSKGDFSVSRKDNILTITGKVTHEINDVYDFNNDTFLDSNGYKNERLLAEKGYAKPFMVEWKKTQTFKGTAIINNGNIEKTNFKWLDDNP